MNRKTVTRLMKAVTAGHVALFRASRGRLGSTVVGMPVLLLTTTGRRTGRPRVTPLTYIEDGERLVVAGSNGGNPWFPAWYLNLRANPRAQVRLRGRKMNVTAEVAPARERQRLWPSFIKSYPGYRDYEQKTTRRIPVVILTPEA